MSSAKVDSVLVFDPVVDIHKQKAYAVVRGAKESTYQTFAATNISNSQVNLSCNPPSMSTLVDRRVYLQGQYTITIRGPDAGIPLLTPGFDAPRAFPINRSIQTLSATLNNDSFSIVQNQVLDPLLKYQDRPYDRSDINTITPSTEDSYLEYDYWQNSAFNGGGSARNVLGGYGENSDKPGRGSFVGVDIQSNTNTEAIVVLTVTEPIMMSPFAWSKNSEKEPGWIGLQNMSLSLTFGDLASALWSHNDASGATFTSVDVQVNQFSALFHYMTPPSSVPIPQTTVYPYYETVAYNNSAITLQAGQSTVSTLNSVQLKSIPKRCYLVAMEQYSDLTGVAGVGRTNTFANISNVNITFNNKSGLLSSMTEQQLYEMSVKNGSKQTWDEWHRFQGSVMAIDFASDLSLDDMACPGKSGNYQFQVQCTIKNPRPTSLGSGWDSQPIGRIVNYVLRLITVSEGVVVIHDGSVSHQIGVISDQDLYEAKPALGYSYDASASVYGGELQYRGGGIWGWLKNAGKKLFGFAKDHKLVSRGLSMIPHPIGQIASHVADTVGLGMKKRKKGGVRAGRKAKKSGGGGMMSRAELKRRLGGAQEYSDSD